VVFKGTWRGIAQRIVESLAVIEELDVLKDDLSGLLVGGEALVVRLKTLMASSLNFDHTLPSRRSRPSRQMVFTFDRH